MTLTFTVNLVLSASPDILSRVDTLMATLADFTAKLDGIDAKVAEVAAEIVNLKAQIANGGLTADEEAQVLARLDTLTASLDAAK